MCSLVLPQRAKPYNVDSVNNTGRWMSRTPLNPRPGSLRELRRAGLVESSNVARGRGHPVGLLDELANFSPVRRVADIETGPPGCSQWDYFYTRGAPWDYIEATRPRWRKP